MRVLRGSVIPNGCYFVAERREVVVRIHQPGHQCHPGRFNRLRALGHLNGIGAPCRYDGLPINQNYGVLLWAFRCRLSSSRLILPSCLPPEDGNDCLE